MPILESISFLFNNQSSTDYGVINCKVDTGLFDETFIPNREIREISTRKSDSPYFVEVKSTPRILNLTIAFTDDFDETKLRSFKRWLSQDFYKPIAFESLPDIVFYVLLVDSTPLLHNGKSGYIQANFRCSDQYAYSSQYTSEIYDLSSNPIEGTKIKFENNGDVPCQPQISLIKIGIGDVSIINLSDGAKEFKLTSLTADEDLFIDNENEEITSSLPNTYRLNNLTGDFISLPRGVNNLLIKGNCKLQFRYQFKLL